MKNRRAIAWLGLLQVACADDPKASAGVDQPVPVDTGTPPDPVPDDTPVTDPWPDPDDLPPGQLSLVHDGELLADGGVLPVRSAPAGINQTSLLRLILTNRTDAALTLSDDPAVWLQASGAPIFIVGAPPASLAPDASAAIELRVDTTLELTAAEHHATLTVPGGPEVTVQLTVPRPLRLVVTGSDRYVAVSDTYGADFSVELHPDGDETTPRDVTWGEGRFFRADRAYNDWNAPGVYQYSEDGLTWYDSAAPEDFWVSDCVHVWERFHCVRSSNWTFSDTGETVLHNAGYWGHLINALAFVPADETGASVVEGDRIVAVGRNGRRTLSVDGLTWVADVDSEESDYFNSVTYQGGLVVAVGGSNRMFTAVSADGGETWAETAFCADTYTTLWSVVAGGGWFLATGQSNLCDEMWRSPDGLSWESTGNSNIHALTWHNGWFIGVEQYYGYPATLVRSVDGLSWEAVHSVPEGVSIQAAAAETMDRESL